MEKDIEFFRQEYKKQKKLEVIVNSRVLKKPKINNPDIHYMDIMLTRGKIEINANIALLLEHIFIGICKGE